MGRIDACKQGNLSAADARRVDAYTATLEREFAGEVLPWRISALLIFVSTIVCWVVTYGLGVFIYQLIAS